MPIKSLILMIFTNYILEYAKHFFSVYVIFHFVNLVDTKFKFLMLVVKSLVTCCLNTVSNPEYLDKNIVKQCRRKIYRIMFLVWNTNQVLNEMLYSSVSISGISIYLATGLLLRLTLWYIIAIIILMNNSHLNTLNKSNSVWQ